MTGIGTGIWVEDQEEASVYQTGASISISGIDES